MEGAL
jgi:hypothetical protein